MKHRKQIGFMQKQSCTRKALTLSEGEPWRYRRPLSDRYRRPYVRVGELRRHRGPHCEGDVSNMAGQTEMGRQVGTPQMHACRREPTGRKKAETHALRLGNNNKCTTGLILDVGLRELAEIWICTK